MLYKIPLAEEDSPSNLKAPSSVIRQIQKHKNKRWEIESECVCCEWMNEWDESTDSFDEFQCIVETIRATRTVTLQ
jgi:hypothetical protein